VRACGDDPDHAVFEKRRKSADSVAGVRAGEAHALAILDAALDAVITIDHLGRVLEFNLAAERTFGYQRRDVLGQELAELVIPPDFREPHRRALARWTAAGPTPGAGRLLGQRSEVQAMRSDGSVFPAELAISRVDVPGPPLFTACIRDVSDRKDTEEALRGAEFRYRTLVEQLPLISYVDSAENPSSKPLYLSPQIEAVLGHTPERWLSTPGLYERSIHEEDREHVLDEKRAGYERGDAIRVEYRMVAADGRVVWVEDQSVLVEPPEGGLPFRQGFAIDITERKRAEEALRGAEARYRTLVEQLPLAVYIDAVDEVSSNIYTSPQLEPMLGYTVEEWQSDPLLFVRMLHPEDRERALAAHAHTHATREPLSIDYRVIARDGRVIWVHDEARVVEDGAGPPVLQGYLLDISERRETDELLRRQAFQDPLTGLANRALFADRVQHALELRQQSGGQTAVLFLDIDDFKRVNDTLGHPAGDTLLCEAGARLRAALAPSHTVARLGGDEFAILVEEDLEPAAVAGIAERLLAALQLPFSIAGCELFVTASVGIALGRNAEELLRSADVAMYRAKASGKAQHRFYKPTMDEALLGRLELIADLRRANFSEELVLHYQPAVDLRTSSIVGVEALVRWEHPTRGLLPPSDFIPVAEETLLIDGIGRWVLAEACRQLARWRHELPDKALTMSVNVSARQLERRVLVDDVKTVLAESGLDASALTLEITESALAHGHDEVRAVIRSLQELGVRLALDDFGSGYSSLSLLQELPVDVLKIDRSFVEGVESTGRRAALLRAIVEIARALGLTVVAEGVENARQAAALRRLGCPLAQGFYFARPLPAAEIDALLRVSSERADSPAA
jgi:diguanylate cyclase (GGDEF)-like protein/PAS domain S-box-containing protein